MTVADLLHYGVSKVLPTFHTSLWVQLNSKFDVLPFKAKNRVFEFDYLNMNMFESVQCSKKWYSSLFDDKFSKSSEGLLGLMFDGHSFEAKIQMFKFD